MGKGGGGWNRLMWALGHEFYELGAVLLVSSFVCVCVSRLQIDQMGGGGGRL